MVGVVGVYREDSRVEQFAEEWRRINVPDPLPVVDGLLAATARVLRLTLVTRNLADVKGVDIEVLDPFES